MVMASRFPVFSLLLIAAPLLASAATPTANLTDILAKNGAFTNFLHLLNSTQVLTQIQNQLNTSTEGMTVFAPTDNAFSTLKSGTLNSLSTQNQVQLVLYHVLPKFYNWDSFQTVSNPVQTQASGSDGNWGINIVASGVQNINVSTGVVETQLNNALSQKMPLAVYQVEKVLLPEELFGSKAKSPAKAPATSSDDSTESSSSTAKSSAAEPTAADKEKNGASGLMMRTGGWLFGLVIGVVALVL